MQKICGNLFQDILIDFVVPVILVQVFIFPFAIIVVMHCRHCRVSDLHAEWLNQSISIFRDFDYWSFAGC